MTNATEKQITFIATLIARCGYESEISAIDAYGMGLRPSRDLSQSEASELIEWLKSGGQAAMKIEQPFEVGTTFNSARGPGKIITLLSDGRYLVKFNDGSSDFLTASEFMN